MLLPMVHLGSLACFTAINICSNIRLDLRPPIIPSDQFLSFKTAGVSCGDGSMVKMDDLLPKYWIFGYIDSMFPSYELTIVRPTFFLFGNCASDD